MKTILQEVMNGKLFITYTSGFNEISHDDEFDKIEVLSSEIDSSDEFFVAPISSFEEQDNDSCKRKRKEKERKRAVRVVALVSGILLLVSVVLVAVSLYMSKDIDEMGKHHDNMSLYSRPPYIPLLYSKIGVYRDIYFVIFAQNIDYG